jgi:hypothetical protein
MVPGSTQAEVGIDRAFGGEFSSEFGSEFGRQFGACICILNMFEFLAYCHVAALLFTGSARAV